jgi:2-octaprenyl-6-methoxyphenol hydroxylase
MSKHHHDIAVVGAGAAGIAAALAFAREGYSVALIGKAEARRDGRTVALLDGSIRFLDALGVWGQIEPLAAPLETMRIIDDTPNLFRAPTVSFVAREIGLDAFGWNVENASLVEVLAKAAVERPEIDCFDAQALTTGYQDTVSAGSRDHRIAVRLSDGTSIAASLVVAADGRKSRLREAAEIRTRSWSYPQSALTTILAHDKDHRDISTEFHTRHGPFTLVPLPGRRSSLVWVTDPTAAEHMSHYDDGSLARAVERQAHSLLGKMRIDGPRGLIPMSGLSVDRFHADRIALVGEAAHVFPPIGAQGLNLGFRDVAALRDAVVEAGDRGHDIGSEAALAPYERGRRLDVRMRTTGVDMLNRTLLAGILPADMLRGIGLHALQMIGPLRRMMMREGVTPRIGTPQLMRRDSTPAAL